MDWKEAYDELRSAINSGNVTQAAEAAFKFGDAVRSTCHGPNRSVLLAVAHWAERTVSDAVIKALSCGNLEIPGIPREVFEA